MPIYTKTGDTGSTSLFGGKRVLKCEELVEVYGSIDELNSWIGRVASEMEVPDVQVFLSSVQSDLFTIGSHLAGWKTDLQDLPKRVKEMEARIDVLDETLPKLHNFILPGGTKLASVVHVARAVCRRVERQTVALTNVSGKEKTQSEKVDPRVLIYLNRLSDLLFMLARFVNHQAGIIEVTWSGIDRKGKKQ